MGSFKIRLEEKMNHYYNDAIFFFSKKDSHEIHI